jgi:hypothetical protein
MHIVFGLAGLLVIVLPNSPVGAAVADIAYAGVRQVFDANPPTDRKPTTPAAEWKVGSTLPVSVTLITADYSKLYCLGTESFKGYHCGYEDQRKPWPPRPGAPLDDNKRDILQPYRTAANELILVGGLWADPHVAQRLHEEPPHSRNQDRLARFVAHCQLEFIGVMKDSKVRWAPGAPWLDPDGAHIGPAGGIPVAIPRGCEIEK